MPSGAKELPENLDWYRQAGTWMVSLATGAVAAGILMGDQIRPANPLIKAAFVLAGLCFLATIVAGMLFHFWVLKYAGTLIRKQRLEDQQQSTTAFSDSSSSKELEEVNKTMQEGKKQIINLHGIILILFPLGAVFASLGVLALIFPRPEPPKKFLIADIEGATVGLQVHHTTLLLSETDGRSWELVRHENGTLLWMCVPRVPASTADSCNPAKPQSIRASTGGMRDKQNSAKGDTTKPPRR